MDTSPPITMPPFLIAYTELATRRALEHPRLRLGARWVVQGALLAACAVAGYLFARLRPPRGPHRMSLHELLHDRPDTHGRWIRIVGLRDRS